MPKKYKAGINDLASGLNDSMDPSAIGPSFATKLINFYPRGKHLYRRNGQSRVTSTALAERVTGLFALGRQVGEWLLIAGSQTGISKIVGGVPTALTNTDGVLIPAADNVWRMRQYKNIGYAVRGGIAGLIRFDEDQFSLAGIDAPTTTLTLVAVAGGTDSMEAGDRHVRMTFVNLDTDVESNPSPDSAAVTLVADDKILVSNAEVPTDPQVNGRRFYVELPDIPGQYYLALTTTDITSTGPFTIDKQIDNLGGLLGFRNAPPEAIEYIDLEVWKERLWLTDGIDVLYSENVAGVGLAECFDPNNYIPIFPDDRNRITCLRAFGERLVVGKTNGVHSIVTSGSGFEVQTLSDRQGCPAPGSMRTAEGLLWWYSGENVYQTNGATLETVSDPTAAGGDVSKVRALLDAVPDSAKNLVEAAVYPTLGWYILSLPVDSTSPTQCAVFDYRHKRWFVFEHATLGAPLCFGDFLDKDEQPRVYCSYLDSYHVFDFIGNEGLSTDVGEPIVAIFRSAGFDAGASGFMHRLRRAGILVDPIPATCTVRAYEENESTAEVTRTGVKLDQVRQLQRISLPSRRSFHTQVEIEYNGEPRLVLKALQIEADVFGYEEQPE